MDEADPYEDCCPHCGWCGDEHLTECRTCEERWARLSE